LSIVDSNTAQGSEVLLSLGADSRAQVLVAPIEPNGAIISTLRQKPLPPFSMAVTVPFSMVTNCIKLLAPKLWVQRSP